MRILNRLLLFFLLGLLSCTHHQNVAQHAKVTLLSENQSLKPGDNWIGLRFQLEPGWHIYWVNPGDSGEPPKVTWHLPSGFQAGELQFPAPARIHDHSLIDYGYENGAVLLSRLAVPNGAHGSADINADVRWLVCREVCIPGRGTASLKLPVGGEDRQSPDADLIRTTERQLSQPLPADVVLSGRSTTDNFVLRIASKTAQLGTVKDFYPLDPGQIENTFLPQIRIGKDTVEITVRKSEQLSQPIQSLRGILIVDDRACAVTFPISSAAHSGSRASSH